MKISMVEMDQIIKYISKCKVLSLTFGPDYVKLNDTKKNEWALNAVKSHRKRKSK